MQKADEFLGPSDEVTREARAWVARLHSHEIDTAEAKALELWRRRSAAHEQAFAEANRRWTLFRSAALNLAAQGQAYDFPRARAVPAAGIGRRALLGGALAASAAGVAYLALQPPLNLWPSLNELAADYRTTTGQQQQIALADTVSIEMNTQTSLSVRPAQQGAATIEVISGQVAVTAKSSVMVIAGGGRTHAEQGVFDVRNEAGRVSVACLGGDAYVICGGDQVALRPDQRIVYDGRGMGGLSAVDPIAIEAWRRGLLIFAETPLSQVVDEINRYRHGHVILVDASLGSLPVNATFRIDRIDDAVPRLADVFGAKLRSLPGGIVLLG
jgi:transmembrane sensor